MNKALNLLIAAFVIIIGIAMFKVWLKDFFIVLRGVLPIFVIIGGGIGVAASISEMRDIAQSKKEENK